MRNYTEQEINGLGSVALYDLARELEIHGASVMGDTELRDTVRRRLQREQRLGATTAASVSAPAEPLKPAMVRITYGAYDHEYEVAGQPLGTVLEKLARGWSLPPREKQVVHVNGVRVTDFTTRIEAGAHVEVAKDADDKGRR